MKEWIVNLFAFVDSKDRMPGESVVYQIGAVWHQRDGTDEQKMQYLQDIVEEDVHHVKRYPLPTGCVLVDKNGRAVKQLITYRTFNNLGPKLMELLEESVFSQCPFAPREPLMVLTPVVDGVVTIEGFTRFPN